MKICNLHRSFSVLMAFLVLFSTVSFTIEKHFCGDTLIDVAVFTQAQKCDMEMDAVGHEAISKKNCCKDEEQVVKGQDALKSNSFEDFELEPHLFLTAFLQVQSQLFDQLPQHIIPHKEYSPPNLVVDIQLVDQVFLI